MSYLRAEHRKEIEAVSHCQTAVAVRRAAKRGSDLLKHLQDEPYRGSYAVAKKKKKEKPSGCQQRKKRGLQYRTADWQANKYGTDPDAGTRIQQTYNAKRRA